LLSAAANCGRGSGLAVHSRLDRPRRMVRRNPLIQVDRVKHRRLVNGVLASQKRPRIHITAEKPPSAALNRTFFSIF
jgi:hypothetical protein